MPGADVDNLHDVVWLGIPHHAMLAGDVRSVANPEADISGVLRLLRGEEFAALERPCFGPYGFIASQHDVAPLDDLLADRIARDALALNRERDALRGPGRIASFASGGRIEALGVEQAVDKRQRL
jgi:hypothetical protein